MTLQENGSLYREGSNQSSYDKFDEGQVIGCGFDVDTRSIFFTRTFLVHGSRSF